MAAKGHHIASLILSGTFVELLQFLDHRLRIAAFVQEFMDHRAGFVLKVNVARIAWSHIRAVERWKGVAEKVVRQPIGFFIHPSRAMSGLAPALYVKRPLAFRGRHVACVFNRYRWIFAIRGNCQAGSSQNRAGALTPANTTQVAELQRLPSIARTGIVGISVCEWAIRNFVA